MFDTEVGLTAVLLLKLSKEAGTSVNGFRYHWSLSALREKHLGYIFRAYMIPNLPSPPLPQGRWKDRTGKDIVHGWFP